MCVSVSARAWAQHRRCRRPEESVDERSSAGPPTSLRLIITSIYRFDSNFQAGVDILVITKSLASYDTLELTCFYTLP